ncbi:MAG: S8 family peptidase [Chthoniobacterales bacterium]
MPPFPDNQAPLPFDPKVLDRSVIATPLLDQINDEKALINEYREKYPKEAKQYNSVIFLPPETKVTPTVIKSLDKLVRDTAQDAGAQPEKHEIGKRLPDSNGVFAWLDARTIHLILNRHEVWLAKAEQAQRAKRKPPENEPTVIINRILPSRFKVIIDLNLEFIAQRSGAYDWVKEAIAEALQQAGVNDDGQVVNEAKSQYTDQYIFATIEADVIYRIVEMDADAGAKTAWVNKRNATGQQTPQIESVDKAKLRAIYRIWPDFQVRARITRSIATVKANAAINSFAARGSDITWAVLDTGIQDKHPHFQKHNNLHHPKSPAHRDFTATPENPLEDRNGHGTHVAGIIAGEWTAKDDKGNPVPPSSAVSRYLDEHGDEQQDVTPIEAISGMAPECRLVSLKVLDENGIGNASNLIAAIAYVQEINGHGRRVLIHGINISIGYDFDPKWFACGQSPLCVEVDRLVKSGVVVVVAAGNTGYGAVNNGASSAGLTVTINDPGNAELAITVGATHRDMPHTYGVSYFSSKGPTGDGRLKPDLVAPGEKIISCAGSYPGPDGQNVWIASELKNEVAQGKECDYIETSGTSMAAPHVSGLVAAFLSVRREFVGQPEEVKRIFLSTCTDLRRDRYFQGAGLIDLMRAIQSV